MSQVHHILETSTLSRIVGPPESTRTCSSSPPFYISTPFLRSGGALAGWKHLRSTLGTLGIQAGGAPNMWGSVTTARADALASPACPLPSTSSALTAPSSTQDSHISNIPVDGLLNGAYNQSCAHAMAGGESSPRKSCFTPFRQYLEFHGSLTTKESAVTLSCARKLKVRVHVR
jgi:hypothetical protein